MNSRPEASTQNRELKEINDDKPADDDANEKEGEEGGVGGYVGSGIQSAKH